MGIDIEVGVGQEEREGRNILGYMFEGPEDMEEDVVDNSVWLGLEIACFFFRLNLNAMYAWIIVLNCVRSIELSVFCPWICDRCSRWRWDAVTFYLWRVGVMNGIDRVASPPHTCTALVGFVICPHPPPTGAASVQAVCSTGGCRSEMDCPNKK